MKFYSSLLLPEIAEAAKFGEPVCIIGAAENKVACGALAGYMKDGVFKLASLYVSPAYRKKGCGRWLWIWLEVVGEEQSTVGNIRVYVPGENFFKTFPQVYQQDNDFLNRYLSIFSTMYHEFQEKIDSLHELLDVDTAPEELLPVFASWLGIETDPMLLGPDDLRKLLKTAPKLMEYKGTKWAVEAAVKLFVSEDVYIVERNLLMTDQRHSENLYGTTPYDFTVMISRKTDEKLRLRLQFLIDQIKPVRSRYNIVFLQECGGLDAYTYLDPNGAVLQSTPGNLDSGNALAGMTYLE